MYYDYCFSNASEFQEFFGLKDYGNGSVSRKNKILLAVLKSKSFRDFCNAQRLPWYRLNSMGALREFIDQKIRMYSRIGHHLQIDALNLSIFSQVYRTDSFNGECTDGDTLSIRYILAKTGKVYKMRAGKFLSKVLSENEFFNVLPEQAKIWYIESQVQQLATKRNANNTDIQLTVDDNFEFIYQSGNFGSCMAGNDQWEFYRDSTPGAKAAYLCDLNDQLLARCIIFRATDQNGKVWRLAERQYSRDGDDGLKRLLAAKLISDGHIDAYKRIGAGCGDASAYDAIDGRPLDDLVFQISCNLDESDTLSYQDSFKWYDMGAHTAYNHPVAGADIELDTTSPCLGVWDEYNEHYAANTVRAIYDGREIEVDEDELDDFTWCDVDDIYVHDSHVVRCAFCGEYAYSDGDNCYYSELTEEYYDCESCMEKAEFRYKEDNWFYSSYDAEFYEDEDDIVTLASGDTISVDSLNDLIGRGKVVEIEEGVYEFV